MSSSSSPHLLLISFSSPSHLLIISSSFPSHLLLIYFYLLLISTSHSHLILISFSSSHHLLSVHPLSSRYSCFCLIKQVYPSMIIGHFAVVLQEKNILSVSHPADSWQLTADRWQLWMFSSRVAIYQQFTFHKIWENNYQKLPIMVNLDIQYCLNEYQIIIILNQNPSKS